MSLERIYQVACLEAILGDSEAPADYQQMAEHFERKRNWPLAGKYFFMAGHYSKVFILTPPFKLCLGGQLVASARTFSPE